jgi:hypothetical protein
VSSVCPGFASSPACANNLYDILAEYIKEKYPKNEVVDAYDPLGTVYGHIGGKAKSSKSTKAKSSKSRSTKSKSTKSKSSKK